MKVADAIARILKTEGAEFLSAYPTTPVIEAAARADIRPVRRRAELVADQKVDVEKLFTHRWKLEQAEEAYRLFDTQTTRKAVILPS